MKLLVSCLILLPVLNEVVGFSTKVVSPLSQRSSLHRPYGCYATTKEKQKEAEPKEVQPKVEIVKGDANADSSMMQEFNSSHIQEVIDEISRRINDGSTELFENMTVAMEERLDELPNSSALAFDPIEFSEYLGDLANQIQKAQQDELQRQLDALEKRFLDPFEKVAFSDAPLFDTDKKPKPTVRVEETQEEPKLVLAGPESTLGKSARMSTADIIRNLNVAPFYYSVALLYRWFRKASYPSLWLLSSYKNLGFAVKTRGPRRSKKRKGELSYEEYIKDAEAMQTGWKRTGEIAAKGSLARKWAILRRSAEIWAYFSSFYLKDRRITSKYQSGRWSEERFSEERSKLGAEITQNLLKLGPTFIKVRLSNRAFAFILGVLTPC